MNRQTEYLNKELAATRSGLSVRRLLELASNGRIRKRHFKDPKSKRIIAVFHTADLDKLKSGSVGDTKYRSVPDTRVMRFPSSEASPHIASSEALPHSDSASVISPTRPWMTLAEAGEYSGLPSSFITRLIEAGKLPGLDVGVRPGGRWRVAKRDLDALKGERMANK